MRYVSDTLREFTTSTAALITKYLLIASYKLPPSTLPPYFPSFSPSPSNRYNGSTTPPSLPNTFVLTYHGTLAA